MIYLMRGKTRVTRSLRRRITTTQSSTHYAACKDRESQELIRPCCRYYSEALKIPVNKLDKETRDHKRGAAFSNRSLANLRFSSSQAPRIAAKYLVKALEDAQEAIRCRPIWAKAHFRMGESLRHLGRCKENGFCISFAFLHQENTKKLPNAFSTQSCGIHR